MKVKIFLIILAGMLVSSCENADSSSDITAIKAVMKMQEEAWSSYDIDGFMSGYWKSDSLKFYGSNGLTSGWQETLDNYKKRYPSEEHTGKLSFTLDAISPVDNSAYYVMGQYHLERTIGDAQGVFLILFRKINGEWKIIADLSC